MEMGGRGEKGGEHVIYSRDHQPGRAQAAADVLAIEPWLRLGGAILKRAIQDGMLRNEKREVEALRAQYWLLSEGVFWLRVLRSTPIKKQDWESWICAGCLGKFEE